MLVLKIHLPRGLRSSCTPYQRSCDAIHAAPPEGLPFQYLLPSFRMNSATMLRSLGRPLARSLHTSPVVAQQPQQVVQVIYPPRQGDPSQTIFLGWVLCGFFSSPPTRTRSLERTRGRCRRRHRGLLTRSERRCESAAALACFGSYSCS